MPYETKTYVVLIASPSDLLEERQAAKQAIHEWNALHAKAEGIMLDPHMWETHATPGFGKPQDIINEQLVKDADLLIGMFWTKLGTATGAAVSGTVEEIDQIVAAGKPAMLYFSNRPIDPTKVDLEQMTGLKAFQKETYARALVGSFKSPDELRQTLKDDLTRRVRAMKKTTVGTKGPSRDRLYDMIDRAEEADRAMEAEESAGRKRAEEKWIEFDEKIGHGQFWNLWSARVQVVGEGLPPYQRYAHIYLSIIPGEAPEPATGHRAHRAEDSARPEADRQRPVGRGPLWPVTSLSRWRPCAG